MKSIMTILFGLFMYSFLNAQQIIQAEYFIDTDPGLGNANSVSIVGGTTAEIINETVNLTGLDEGHHRFCVRYKDDLGNWSFPDCQTLFIFQTDNEPTAIVQAEYFIDTDPGLGNAIPLSLETIADTTITSDIIDIAEEGLDLGEHCLLVRYKDNLGQWSVRACEIFYVCELDQAVAEFDIVSNSTTISAINNSTNATIYNWDFGDNTGNGTGETFLHTYDLPGTYEVCLTVSNSCLVVDADNTNTLCKSITVTKVDNFYPTFIANDGGFYFSVNGADLSTDSSFELVSPSGVIYSPDSTFINDKGDLSGFITFDHVELGEYEVTVTSPNQAPITFDNNLIVQEVLDALIDLNLYIPRTLISRPTPSGFTISNSGNVTAYYVPVMIAIPEYAVDEVIFDNIISAEEFGIPEDGVSNYIEIDTLFGNINPYRVYSLIIPKVEPGEILSYGFYLRTKQSSLNNSPSEAINRQSYIWNTKPLLAYDFPFELLDELDNEEGKISPDIIQTLLSSIDDSAVRCIWSLGTVIEGAFDYSSCVDWALAILNFVRSAEQKNSEGIRALKAGYLAFSVAVDLTQCALNFSPADEIYKVLKGVVSFLDKASGALDIFLNCKDFVEKYIHKTEIRIVSSFDPNEIIGPNGFSDENYLNNKVVFPYTVFFENVDTATANAVEVNVFDTLNVEHFDFETFQFGTIRIGERTINLSPNQQNFTLDYDMRPEINTIVRINGVFNPDNGVIHWNFLSLNPENMDVHFDPDLGFLPPNVDGVSGQASASYSINRKADLAHGTVISNRASIIFDFNEPIITNTWINTIDLLPPSSELLSIPAVTIDSLIAIPISGVDNESGVGFYTIFASENGGDYMQLYPNVYNKDTVYFAGNTGSYYEFYSIATDNVGNIEIKTPVVEAYTSFEYQTETCQQTISLSAGWNLISLDIEPDSRLIADVFSSLQAGNLEYVTGFDNGALVYDPNLPPFLNTLTQVTDGFGYWVKVQNADNLIVEGRCLDENYRKPLDAGWNLVAYPPGNPQAPNVYFADLESSGNLEYVTGFDNGTLTYDPNLPAFLNTLQQMENGFGYWLKVANSSGKALQNPSNIFNFINGTSNLPAGERVNVKSESGKTITVLEVLQNGYLMTTPIYGDDPLTEAVQEYIKVGEKLLFSWNNQALDVDVNFTGDLSIQQVNLVFDNTANLVNELALKVYPVPAKDVVNFEFETETEGEFILQIFDTKGRLVESIKKATLSIGTQIIDCNVQNLSNGIYTYKLISGEQKQAGKFEVIR